MFARTLACLKRNPSKQHSAAASQHRKQAHQSPTHTVFIYISLFKHRRIMHLKTPSYIHHIGMKTIFQRENRTLTKSNRRRTSEAQQHPSRSTSPSVAQLLDQLVNLP